MKLSKDTLNILKNFAGINSNVMLPKGNKLSTISPQRNVMVSVTVPDTFDVDFGIYDLNQFLGVLSLFEDPDVTFTDKVASIKEGRSSIKYYAADKSVLLLPPDKELKFPKPDVEFTMTAAMIAAVQKTSGVLSAPDLTIAGDGNIMSLVVSDIKNSSNNVYEIQIGTTSQVFKANIKIDYLKILPQDYKVELASKGLSKWSATTGDMVAFVALDSTSSF